VFAEGPIGLCATAGARLAGASLVIGVDSVPGRLDFARRMGADVVLNYKEQDVVAEVKRLTGGGADVAIGRSAPADLRELPAQRSLGARSPAWAFTRPPDRPARCVSRPGSATTIVTSLCPGGKEHATADERRRREAPFRGSSPIRPLGDIRPPTTCSPTSGTAS
jgi:threonine dehydrogenase-like Zn-dependent dehydrogenase